MLPLHSRPPPFCCTELFQKASLCPELSQHFMLNCYLGLWFFFFSFFLARTSSLCLSVPISIIASGFYLFWFFSKSADWDIMFGKKHFQRWSDMAVWRHSAFECFASCPLFFFFLCPPPCERSPSRPARLGAFFMIYFMPRFRLVSLGANGVNGISPRPD